jgi:hypothetical protein
MSDTDKKELQPWTVKQDSFPMQVYTPCQASDDINMISEHVGLEERVECVHVYCARTTLVMRIQTIRRLASALLTPFLTRALHVRVMPWQCGYCWMQAKAEELKKKYAEMYDLEQEKINSCNPETALLHIKKEHLARTGKPMAARPEPNVMQRT